MFILNKKYEINRNILKCDYIQYSSSQKSTINTANSQIYFKKPREDSVVFLLKGYVDLNFDVFHATTNSRYADGNDIRLVNLGPIALINNYILTTSSGKHLEDKSHAHNVSLMFKLLTSAKDTNHLSIRFDRDCKRRQRELTNNKNQKSENHIRILLKDFFWFCWTSRKTYLRIRI